jgi:hypothetical protein
MITWALSESDQSAAAVLFCNLFEPDRHDNMAEEPIGGVAESKNKNKV